MSTVNFMYDKRNDFGTLANATSTTGDFPNIIFMDEATAERMAVDLKLPNGNITGGGTITLSVLGCDTNSTTAGDWKAIATGIILAAADVNKGGYSLAIPKNGYKCLKANLKVTAAVTGEVQAIINTYLGK